MSNAFSIFNAHSDPKHLYHQPGLLGHSVWNDAFTEFFNTTNWLPLQNKTVQGYPVCDIYRSEDGSTVLEFALAGFKKDDLTIEVKPEKRSITVSASSEDKGETARRIAKPSFTKTYVNYDADLDLTATEAKFENGLLTITVPTRPEVKPLAIEIG